MLCLRISSHSWKRIKFWAPHFHITSQHDNRQKFHKSKQQMWRNEVKESQLCLEVFLLFLCLRSPQKKLQSKDLLNSKSYHILKWKIPLHTDQRQEHPYNTTQPYRIHHFSNIPIAAAFSTSKCGKKHLKWDTDLCNQLESQSIKLGSVFNFLHWLYCYFFLLWLWCLRQLSHPFTNFTGYLSPPTINRY